MNRRDNQIMDEIATIIDDEIVNILRDSDDLEWVEFRWEREDNKRDLRWGVTTK